MALPCLLAAALTLAAPAGESFWDRLTAGSTLFVSPGGNLGPVEIVRSAHLATDVVVRVYTPPPRADAPARLPILYVSDGSDYWRDDMGDLVATLDGLIARRRIPPLVAVFIDSLDARGFFNRRDDWLIPGHGAGDDPFGPCPFCEFIVDELRPRVEARFAIDGARRAVLGTSLGGLNAAYLGLRYPDLFPLVVAQSPALDWYPWIVAGYRHGKSLPRRVAIDAGRFDTRYLPGAQALRDAMTGTSIQLRYDEAPSGHSWEHWRATVGPALEFVFAAR